MKAAIKPSGAPAAIGPYSPAIKVQNTVYLSGQIPLDPSTNELIRGDVAAQVAQVFENLQAVTKASGGDLNSIVRLCIYLTDLNHFPIVNEVMSQYFSEPYPARTTIGVAALPKNANVEVDGIMVV
jgi:reactive intermediate/imine deaminase